MTEVVSGAYIEFAVTKPLARDYAVGEFLDVYEHDKRITVKLVVSAQAGDRKLRVVPVIVESET